MQYFVAVSAVWLTVNLVVICLCLAIDVIPQRTKTTLAFEVVTSAAVVGWCIYLLAKA